MANETKRKATIEVYYTYDWKRDYTYYSVFVAIKADYQRYDLGKAKTQEQGVKKAKNWIKKNLADAIIESVKY